MSSKLLALNDEFILEIIRSPLYDIHPDGTIYTIITKTGKKSVKNEWRIGGTTSSNGYREISYKPDGKTNKRVAIHRIIYAKFLAGKNGNPELLQELVINHKNGIKTDNSIENLELVTNGDNARHKYRVLNCPAVVTNYRLNWEIVCNIRLDRTKGYTYKQLSEKYDISKGHVCDIVNHKIWQFDRLKDKAA